MEIPIIYLAFTPEEEDSFPYRKRERKNIYRSLRRHHDEGLIRVEQEAATTLEDLFAMLDRYGPNLAIFHYGGSGLAPEAMRSLAVLLGGLPRLQLVFLSGSATGAQVRSLLDAGVPAVMVSAQENSSAKATEFSEQFYNSLASHTPVRRAFQVARAFLAAKYRHMEAVGQYDQPPDGVDAGPADWGLYLSEARREEVLQWTFPRNPVHHQVLRTRFDYESRMDVNDLLIDILCEEVAKYNRDLDYELSKEQLDIPSIKREIVDSFPTPIGEQLRKLFARSNDPGKPDEMEQFTLARLRQLAVTHRSTVQFICYILLTQLWDEKHQKPAFQIKDDYIVDFNSFFALTEQNFQSFDYVKLINTITDIFDDAGIPYFIEELQAVQIDALKNKELYEAYVFMNRLYETLQDKQVPAEQMEELCTEAEFHLGTVLKAIAFLVKYRLVTIKNIELVKSRHQPARFRHSQITLNGALTVASIGTSEVGVEFHNFTDNKSVLFIKTDGEKVKAFLNLSPFIIDENALNQDYSSKLFLFSYLGRQAYSYQFLNNLTDDPLVVDQQTHAEIKAQFDRFRADIFGQDFAPETSEGKPRTGGSRFSRKR